MFSRTSSSNARLKLFGIFGMFILLLLSSGCGGSGDSDTANTAGSSGGGVNTGGGGTTVGTGGGGGTGGNTGSSLSFQWDPADFSNVYHVGPGQTYVEPGDVPWESIGPSSLVLIHYRPVPYAAKWVLNTTGTRDDPVVVLGVPENGNRPVITGDNAVTRMQLDYWNEVRSVVKVGGSSTPNNPGGPSHIYIQGLEIRSGRPAYSFTDDGGNTGTYSSNAASIHVEDGDHIFIHDCILTDSGNGLFAGSQVSDLVVNGNHIHGNGIENRIYEHNSYTECQGITFEYNHYGPLRANCGGNNLKDRSSGTVVRYNWIEGGNRQLDLVETDHDFIHNAPAYAETFVYGNILIEPDGAGNSQIVHYGGDGGSTSMYREGVLYFFHNTVVSTRAGNTTLVRMSSNPAQARIFNNALVVTAAGNRFAITAGMGQITLENNWLPTGWRNGHSGLDPGATITDLGNHEGTDPGFTDIGLQNFVPESTSDLCGLAGTLPSEVSGHSMEHQYVKHRAYETRPDDGVPDAGAYEYAP